MTYLEIGAAAEAVDGPCGRIGAILLRSDTATLTHVVVEHRGHGRTARIVAATAIDLSQQDDTGPPGHPGHSGAGGCRLTSTRDEVDAATEADALSLVEVSHGSGAGPLNPSGAMPGIMSLSKWVGEGPDDTRELAGGREVVAPASLLATAVHRNPPGTARVDGSTPVVDVDDSTLATVVGLRLDPDLALVGVVARPHGLQHELRHDLVEYPVAPGRRPEVTDGWIRFPVAADEVESVPFHR